MFAFLAWLLFRYFLAMSFYNSEYQGYVYLFAVAAGILDFAAFLMAVSWSNGLREQALASGKNSILAHRVAGLGFFLTIIFGLFCASAELIESQSATGSTANFQGSVAIDQAISLPEGGCFTVPEVVPYTDHLGTVELDENYGGGKFYYAAPMEMITWQPSRPVRIWAVVDEFELSDGALTKNKTFVHIPQRSAYYNVFRLAVSNAEEHRGLQSASNAILVRLIDSPGLVASYYQGTNFWILIAYGSLALLIVSFPILYALAPRIREAANGAPADMETIAPSNDFTSQAIHAVPSFAKRRYWFGLHVLGFVALAFLMVASMPILPAIVVTITVPLLELWLLMRSFPHPKTRESIRMAVTWLMPVAMGFALILVVACIYRHGEYAQYDSTVILASRQSAPPEGTIVPVSEELKMRTDLTGSYWAPNDQTKAWRLVPLLKDDWEASEPVDLWVKSNDRLDSVSGAPPLRFARVLDDESDFRLSRAIADASTRHGVQPASNVLMLEPVAKPEQQLGEGNAFVLIGFTFCLLSWCASALFWPLVPEMTGMAD